MKLIHTILLAGALVLGAHGQVAPTATPLGALQLALQSPARVASDPAGNLFVTDALAGQVVVFDSFGRLAAVRGGLGQPLGIAVDAQGQLYLGDQQSGSVSVFDASGALLYKLGAGNGEFLLPNHIAVTTAGGLTTVYVADSLANQVKAYRGATWIGSVGGAGSGNGQFNFPAGVCVATNGDVFVVDQGNDRVQVFDSAGTFLRTFKLKTGGMTMGPTGRAQGATLDTAGRLYIADAYQGLVKVFHAAAGTFLGTVSSFGPRPGQLSMPGGLSVDRYGRLCVASANNSRVEIFGLDSFLQLAATPATDTVYTGTNLTFSVTAGGGGFAYQWLKNGAAIAGANAAQLSVNGVTAADAGSYAVIVTGPAGAITSGVSQVAVSRPPVGPDGPNDLARYINLHDFIGGADDGASPFGSLTLMGSALWGVTGAGGVSNAGTLFALNSDGSGYTNLHHFAGGTDDGATPYGSLTLVGTRLFGLTSAGGISNAGTIFALNTDGSGYTNLHHFAGDATDGATPFGALTQVGSTLYGLTSAGGISNAGTIFALNADGSGYTNLHHFTDDATDGAMPFGSLLFANGKLYGLASAGGSGTVGTIFALNTDGSGYATLHHFAGGASDGATPFGSLALTAAGQLCGMARAGGSSNVGVVFVLNTDGSGYTNLHHFAGGASDGANPVDAVTVADGKLYGLTSAGGAHQAGALFALNSDGSGYTNLYHFAGSTGDGGRPYGALAYSAAQLFGLTTAGGASDSGVVFAVSLPVTLAVTAAPAAGGIVTGGGNYFAGTNVEISATAADGWLFTGWSDGETSPMRNVTVPPSNSTYTANFSAAAQVAVVAEPAEGGLVAGEGLYVVGASVQLSAAANNNWLFMGWSDGETNAVRTIATPASNALYVARFSPTAPITVAVGAGGGGTVSGGGVYSIGASIQLTAVASNGWVFGGWNDGVLNAMRTIIVASNTAYTASFTPVVTLTLLASPAEAGNAFGGGAYPVGAQPTVVAAAAKRWKFLNWSDGNTNSSRAYLVASNATLTANFTNAPLRVLLQAGKGGLAGQWLLGTNNLPAAWLPMTGAMGNNWILRALNRNHVLLQQGDGGMIGLWELQSSGVPTNFVLVSAALPGWIARDLDGNRILLQAGDGGPVGLWTLNASYTPATWKAVSGPIPGLIARAMKGNRILVQFAAGTPIGYWLLNGADNVTAWQPITTPLAAGWVLRSMTPNYILLQAGDGGLSGVWELDAGGQPSQWAPVSGALPGWTLRSVDDP